MEKAKQIIGIILSAMLLLEGCYSYSPLVRESSTKEIPADDRDILVRTSDERDIEVPSHHFVAVKVPSNFVYGVGELSEKDGKHYSHVQGKIYPIARREESIDVPVSWGKYERTHRIVLVLADSSLVRMNETDCIIVDSTQGNGLWCTGMYQSGLSYARFAGRIPFDQVQSIQVRKFSVVKSAAFGLSIVALLTLGLVAAIVMHDGHMTP